MLVFAIDARIVSSKPSICKPYRKALYKPFSVMDVALSHGDYYVCKYQHWLSNISLKAAKCPY